MKHSFKGIARFDSEGKMVCFCYEDDVRSKSCTCVCSLPCYEVDFSLDLLRTIPPLDESVGKVASSTKRVSKSIKRGIANLEKQLRKSNFRV